MPFEQSGSYVFSIGTFGGFHVPNIDDAPVGPGKYLIFAAVHGNRGDFCLHRLIVMVGVNLNE